MLLSVTPRAGVWIEIPFDSFAMVFVDKSLPVRECGLKSTDRPVHGNCWVVTPRAGVWIEIISTFDNLRGADCHSPCGSVD